MPRTEYPVVPACVVTSGLRASLSRRDGWWQRYMAANENPGETRGFLRSMSKHIINDQMITVVIDSVAGGSSHQDTVT